MTCGYATSRHGTTSLRSRSRRLQAQHEAYAKVKSIIEENIEANRTRIVFHEGEFVPRVLGANPNNHGLEHGDSPLKGRPKPHRIVNKKEKGEQQT